MALMLIELNIKRKAQNNKSETLYCYAMWQAKLTTSTITRLSYCLE